MSFRQIDIKHSYVSYGDENIAKAFLIPMLRKTKVQNSEESISLTCAVIKQQIGIPLTKEELQKEKQISENK